MNEPKEQAPLNYARGDIGPRPPSVVELIVGYFCLIVGILFAGFGLTVFLSNAFHREFEPCSFIATIIGGGLCAIGLRLRRHKMRTM